ncbi:MAG: hypothetical protein V2J89_17315, partial [Halieaceae bacterium]|nr:hypothetical protein [Halieaceae bacterium]
VLYKPEYILQQSENFINLVTEHETHIDNYYGAGTVAGWVTYIGTNGYQDFVENVLDETYIHDIVDLLVIPFVEDFVQAVEDREVLEHIITTIYEDPHFVTYVYPDLDPEIQAIVDDLYLIDFDQIVPEAQAVLDPEEFALALWGGGQAFEDYLDTLILDNTDPLNPVMAENLIFFLQFLIPVAYEAEPFVDEVEAIYYLYIDDVNYALDNLDMFSQYFDLLYYVNGDMMNMDADVTDDFNILVEMEMDYMMYLSIYDDLLDTFNLYLSGFENLEFPYDEDWECITDTLDPNYDEFCDDITDDIGNIRAILTQMESMYMNVLFDPNNTDWMQIELDFTDLAEMLMMSGTEPQLNMPTEELDPEPNLTYITGVNNLSIVFTIEEDTELVLPTETDSVNDIAYDAAKFATTMFARDIIRDLGWAIEQDSSIIQTFVGDTEKTLAELDFLYVNPAFDPELSTITVNVNLLDPTDVEVELDLYWIDGTAVFTNPLSLEDLLALFDTNNDLLSATAYQTMVGYVDDSNFHLTKMLLMLAWQDQKAYDNDDTGH